MLWFLARMLSQRWFMFVRTLRRRSACHWGRLQDSIVPFFSKIDIARKVIAVNTHMEKEICGVLYRELLYIPRVSNIEFDIHFHWRISSRRNVPLLCRHPWSLYRRCASLLWWRRLFRQVHFQYEGIPWEQGQKCYQVRHLQSLKLHLWSTCYHQRQYSCGFQCLC